VKSNHGYVEASVKRLEQEYQDALQFVDAPLFTAVVGKTNGEVGEQQANVNGLLDAVGAVLKKAVSDEKRSRSG
jgi:CRISPR system Cascade subunit CasC